MPDQKRNRKLPPLNIETSYNAEISILFLSETEVVYSFPNLFLTVQVYYKIRCTVNVSIKSLFYFRRETSPSHVLRVFCSRMNRKRKQEICLEQLPVPPRQLNPQTGVLMSSQNSSPLWCIYTCVQSDIKDHGASFLSSTSVIKISACKRWPKKKQTTNHIKWITFRIQYILL